MDSGHAGGPEDCNMQDVRPVRVLVVDDNMLHQRMMYKMITASSVQADVLTDGAQALAAMSTCQYDGIFMDIHMPVMDGVEATRLIRQMGVTIPIVALSTNDVDPSFCMQAGFDAILFKPIEPLQVAQVLQAFAARRANL